MSKQFWEAKMASGSAILRISGIAIEIAVDIIGDEFQRREELQSLLLLYIQL